MLKNYLITAYRQLKRHRATTLMNVISLSIGIACCLVVYVIVKHEYTYDSFQPQADRMYRVVTETQSSDGTEYRGAVSLPIAEALRDELPSVAAATQVYAQRMPLIKRIDSAGNEQRFLGFHTIMADQHFLQVFHYPVLAGDAPSMLQSPDEVVITRPLADRLFGDEYRYEDMIGETLEIDQRDFRIGGVLEDTPNRTNVYFQMVMPLTVFQEQNPEWSASWEPSPKASNAFFTLADGYAADEVAAFLNQAKHRYLEEDLAQRRTYHVQALSDIHTEARYGGTFFSVPLLLLWALASLGVVVLLIGSINFINLSTAQAVQRSKEIGIRKVLGSQKGQLIAQFLGEAGLQVIIASLLAVALAELFLDAINDYMAPFARFIIMQFRMDSSIVLFLALLVIIVTLLAGMYPALVLTRFRPAAVLKQSVGATSRTGFGARFSLRKLLIVTQFVIAQFLLVGTLVTATQMRYFQEQDMGFAQENVLMVDLPESSHKEKFRQQVLSFAGVEQVALGSAPPASRNRSWYEARAAGSAEKHSLEKKVIDPHYLSTFGLSLVAGRNLREEDYATDSITSRTVLLNERAVHMLGFENSEAALGQTVLIDGLSLMRAEVVGVVEDYVNNTLKKEIQPGYFYYSDQLWEAHIRFSGSVSAVLPSIQAQWEALYPDAFFQYELVNEHIAMLYTLEEMLYLLFRLMAGLALAISCLGLYGLASYLTLHRRKEIGIRKALGATVRQIVLRFTREFSGLVLLAFLIAAPLSYLAMQVWLDTFAYRIDIHIGFFVLTLLASIIVAGLTVGYRSVRAAVANPVESLREE